MAISSTQITDYLYKKVGFSITKTDTSTAKYPFNESIASPLLTPGQYIWQQDYAIPYVTSAPSANTVVGGTTVVSVYNTSTSAVVQAAPLTESITNETWNTGITNWIPPSFGSGYQLKLYAGPSGASAATAAQYTQLPVAGVGYSGGDSWFFDYQSGIINFADSAVPAAVTGANVVYAMGAVYTGALGITNYANLNVTGNITSTNGNLVLTNGNLYAQNYYGLFQGTVGSVPALSNVASYSAITPLTTNGTFYVEFANLSVAGNSITGVNSALTFNPSTGVLSATQFSGTGNFTTAVATNFSTGNAQITSGNVNGLTYLQATNFSTGNAVITGGSITGDTSGTFTTLQATNFSSGNIASVTNGAFTTLVSTNFSTGNAVITGGSITGLTNLSAATLVSTNFSTGNAVITGGYADNFPIGANVASTGSFTTIKTTGIEVLGGNVVTDSTPSTSITTGAIVVPNSGGVGIGGNLYVGGNLSVAGTLTYINTQQEIVSGIEVVAGNLVANSGTSSTNTSTGALVVIGGAGINGTLNVGAINVSSGNAITQVATNFSTGNAQITGGSLTGITSFYVTTGYSTNFGSGNILVSGGALSGIANLNATTGTIDNFASGNAAITGGYATGLSNVYTTLGYTTNFSTANAQISGGAITSTPISGSTGYFTTAAATNLSSGNVLFTGGALSGITNLNATTGTIDNFASGNAAITGGSITGDTSGTFTTLQATNFSTGNAVITGGYITGIANVYSTLGYITNFSTGNALITGGALSGIANLNATTGTIANFASGNAVITGGSITGDTSGTFTTLQATNFSSGNITGNFNQTSLNGTVPTANVSLYEQLTNSTTNATYYVPFYDKATGNAAAYTNTSVNVNPSTGTVYATQFVGGGSGITGISGITGGTVTYANVSLYEQVTPLTTNGTFYPIFSNTNTTGNTIAGVNSSLNYNPSTGVLSATQFSGTGNFTTAVATNFSTGNATIQGSQTYIGTSATPIANIYASAGTFTSLSAPGYTIGTTSNITTLQVTNLSSGNVLFTGGYISGLANVYASLAQFTNLSTGNALITGGALSGITNLNATTGTIDNFASGNAAITGGSITGDTSGTFTTLQATNFSTGNATIQGAQTYIGTGTTLISNVYAGTGYFTNLSSGNITGLFNGTVTGAVATANVTYYSAFNAISTNGTYYVDLKDKSTGNGAAYTTSTLTHNPSTGALSATSFNGIGTFTTATTSSTFISSGNIVAASSTPSNNSTTGALVVTGGAGVAGNLYVSGNVVHGVGVNFTPASAPVQIGFNVNNYAQILVQNTNGGNNASTDIVATADNGTDSDTYIDMGINSSTYVQSAYGLTQANDGYLYVQGNTTTGGGNLILATGTSNDIIFATNGQTTTQEIARFKSSANAFVIKSTTITTGPSYGALQVAGGAGFGSNVNIAFGANINQNQGSGPQGDFVMSGHTDKTLIWGRAGPSYDQVLIGNSATSSTLVTGAKLQINSSDSILLPVGTTAQRPGTSGGTDTAGMLRYNTTSGGIEYYNGIVWNSPGTIFTVIVDQQFNGDGSTVAFTLSQSMTTAGCIVSINGVIQIPTLAYSVTGTTLTFTEAPANGDIIDVRELTTTETVTVSGLASVNTFMAVNTDNNGVYIQTSASTVGVTTTQWNTSGAQVSLIANVNVATANTVTSIDTIDNTQYRSAKYIVQVSNGTKYQVQEVLVISDGTTATAVTYGIVQTSGNLGVVQATQSGTNTLIQFIAANATNIVRIKKDYLAI